jgi:hypothetical protein
MNLKKKKMYVYVYLVLMALMTRAYHIRFTPTSQQELHPSSLRLCANCDEAIVHHKTLTCRLFGRTDPVWGVVHYQNCHTTRNNTDECGPMGRYYLRTRDLFEN